jgi:NDP-sugar pyrophosphorylase family protein
MKAMILAAGEGTRLKSLTYRIPKPLLEIDGVPVIERTLLWLRHHGITEVGINLCYLGEQIKAYLGDGSHMGIKIAYSVEEKPLGTAGGVKRMEWFFDGPFVVAYGDNVTDFDLSEMIDSHKQKRTLATVALFQNLSDETGRVETDRHGRIRRFVEKPVIAGSIPVSNRKCAANGGVYVVEPEIFDYISALGPSDFGYDVFPELINNGLPLYGYHLKPDDYLIDIGTPEKYQQANRDLQNRRLEAVC